MACTRITWSGLTGLGFFNLERSHFPTDSEVTVVEQQSASSVKSIANFLVIRIMENGEALLFASGRYVDRIALPELRYEERVVICDSRRFDTLLAIPL